MVNDRSLITISLLFGITSILFIWYGDPGIVSVLTNEDGLVENISAIFYMIAIIVSFISIFNDEHVLLPIIWFFLCVIFLGEETSWFQRLFHYSVPCIEQINVQNEFNLHNLEFFQFSSQSDSSHKSSIFLLSQYLFRFGFFSYFLVVPFLVSIRIFKGLLSKIGYRQPVVGFTIVLFVVFALSFIIAVFAPENVKHDFAETREMLYAFFIMLYVIGYIWHKNKPQTSKFND